MLKDIRKKIERALLQMCAIRLVKLLERQLTEATVYFNVCVNGLEQSLDVY